METKTIAVGYIRVSTAAQAHEGESLHTQRQAIEDYCRGHGLELAEIYTDEGISGKKQKRPGLEAVLNAARKREIGGVIVTRLTRFGRSARDLLNNLGVLEENGVNLISLKENIDTSTPAGRLMRTVLAGIAEFEHETIKDQMHENRNVRWSQNRV